MKEIRFLVLLSLAAVLVFSACGGQAATPTQEEAAPTEEETVRVALVLDGKIDDMGWNQAGYEGLKQAEEDYGVEISYSEEIPIPDFEKALRDYASQGYDMIICHSSIAKDAVMNTANDYPDIAFLWTDGDETLDNLAVIRPLAHEASYLAGMLAGEMTESNTVGMVGGIDIPSTHRSFAAFEAGLNDVNPDAELLVNWIGSFLDVSAGKEAALSQIESGADVIFGNGDGQNIGVLQAASEEEVWAIGAVRDQFEVAPNVVLTSVEWGFRDGISSVVGDFVDGNFEGKIYEISLEEGADLSPYHDNADAIPEDVKSMLEDKREEILSGEFEVPNIPFEE